MEESIKKIGKKLSIIVPVYNAERTIKKCLDSIIKQTFKNIEIIVINDGSTDGTNEICQIYTRKDNRIKYVEKMNEGVSVSRNKGIDMSTGDYITFVDSDDWLEDNAYEIAMDIVIKNNLDMLTFNYNYINEKEIKEKNKSIPNNFITENRSEIQEFQAMMLANRSMGNSLAKEKSRIFGLGLVWNKIFDMRIIKENKIKFTMEKKKAVFEDIVFCYEFLENCNRIGFFDVALYYYFNNITSVTHVYNKDVLDVTEQLVNTILKYKNNHKDDKLYEQSIYCRVLINLCFSLHKYFFYDTSYKKNELKKTIKSGIYCSSIKKIKLKYVGGQVKLYYLGLKLKSVNLLVILFGMEKLLRKVRERNA